ncbi:MAG: alpha/beta fold hydrolase, partial [Polyangiales bacterium]
ERLSGIAVFDTSCREEPKRNRLKYKVMGTITRTLGAVPMLLDRVEPLFFTDRTRADRRELVDPWRGYVSRLDRLSIWHALECIMGRRDLTDRLRKVDMPALVGVGAEDRAQPVAESEHIAGAIPRAQLAIIPDAAHLSAIENPAAVNALLLSFLARLS